MAVAALSLAKLIVILFYDNFHLLRLCCDEVILTSGKKHLEWHGFDFMSLVTLGHMEVGGRRTMRGTPGREPHMSYQIPNIPYQICNSMSLTWGIYLISGLS